MCNTLLYVCNRSLLHTHAVTATSPLYAYAAQLAVAAGIDPSGIDVTVPGHQTHTHQEVARKQPGPQATTTSKCMNPAATSTF